MDRYLLENLTRKLRIAPLNIVRENVEVAFLNSISESTISKKLIFYGGTSLRLGYGSPRFSEDIDFLMTQKITDKELKDVVEHFREENQNVSIKEIKEKRSTLFALINIIEPTLKHPINIKIEICKKKDNIESEFLPLVSPCSHLRPIVLIAAIGALKKLKIEAIKQRNDPKDWFDLWYIYKYLKEPVSFPVKFPFDKKEFVRELKRFLPLDKWELIKQVYV